MNTSASDPSLAAATNISSNDASSGPVIDLPLKERERVWGTDFSEFRRTVLNFRFQIQTNQLE